MKIPLFDMSEFVTGERFQALCDIDCEKDENYEETIRKSEEQTLVVFCQTHELKNAIPFIRTCSDKKFIVVSQNSDGTVGYKQGRDFDYQWQQEDNVYYWFCQNTEVIEPNVIPIPIGLENEYNFRDKTSVVKFRPMCEWNAKQIQKENKMYVCFNRGTNPDVRNYAYEKFSGLPWVTAEEGHNGVNNIKRYFERVAHHQFILSPDGNGLDCVRTWEALYMGAVPIVTGHVFTDYYERYLPIIVVESLDEITLDMLNNRVKQMENRTFQYKMLTMPYWKERISKTKEFVCELPLP